MWAAVFGALRQVSLLHLLRMVSDISGRLARLQRLLLSTWFVDAWALGHLVISLLAVAIVTRYPTGPIALGLVVYGVFRTVEIVILQLDIMLFEPYRRHKAHLPHSLRGYRRSVVLLLQNFGEIVFWFAAAYAILGCAELLQKDLSILGLIRASFVTTISFGSSAPEVVGPEGLAMVAWQGLVGLLVTVLSLARLIGLLPRPDSRDPDDNDPENPANDARPASGASSVAVSAEVPGGVVVHRD